MISYRDITRQFLQGEAILESDDEGVKVLQEKALLAEEPSDYYKDYRAGTITREEYEELVRQYNERERSYSYRPRQPRKTVKVGLEATKERLDVIRRVRAKKDSKFLLSISNQLSMGRDLTDKQNAIIRKIVAKHEPESATLFESKLSKITEEEIRNIIKEEQQKLLSESMAADEDFYNAISDYVEALLTKLPSNLVKAEVLNQVDGYFADMAYDDLESGRVP